MQKGGCHPTDGCYEKGKKFKGADFPYLAANVTDEKTGKPILKPVRGLEEERRQGRLHRRDPGGHPGHRLRRGRQGPEVPRRGRDDQQVRQGAGAQGVKSIVALIHEGGLPASAAYNYDCDSPGAGDGISGPIVDIAKNVTPKVDALVTGHTHHAYACTIPDPSGKPAHGHLGRLLRPALHRHHADLRPPHERHRAHRREGRLRRTTSSTADRAQGRRT